jgi:hypothetical protein
MKKNNRGSLKLAILAIFTVALFTATSALAVTWDAGAWKLGLGGNINAFFVETWASNGSLDSTVKHGDTTITGLNAVNGTDKNGSVTNTSSVSNGLLPASLNFSAATNQAGWDISAHVNVYYGIDSHGANGDGVGVLGDGDRTGSLNNSDALKFSSVDARQVYLTFGKKGFGTVKLGRDFGIFGFDAIINDMTLLSVGAPFLVGDPGHTTLGGLGYGYVYTDRLAQMDYTTPSFGGFQATAGVFQGFDGNGANSADQPGFQGKVSYTGDAGPVKLYASASGLYQKVVTLAGTNDAIWGGDGCVKAGMAGFNFLGYYYYAQGMTNLAIGGLVFQGFQYAPMKDANGNPVLTNGSQTVDPAKSTGDPELSTGYMLQTMYTLGKVRFGANWAQSFQTRIYRVRNDKLTLGVYYNLTPSLTLIAEYSKMASLVKGGDGTDRVDAADVGAILFF